MGRVGLLRLALAVLLGSAAAPSVHPARAASRLGADRREGRRTRSPQRRLGCNTSPEQARPAGRDRRPRSTTAKPSRLAPMRPASTCSVKRARAKSPRGRAILQAIASGHRVDQRDRPDPIRHRETPRKTIAGVCTCFAPGGGLADRCHLAQRQTSDSPSDAHPPPTTTETPWNLSSRSGAPTWRAFRCELAAELVDEAGVAQA